MVALFGGVEEHVDELLEAVGHHPALAGDEDLLVPRRDRPLSRRQQFLIEPLARTHAGELNRDVDVRLETGEADEVARQVHNFDRLAHIEHIHVAVAVHRTGLHHELRRLGDRHEITHHLRMRDCNRPAALDLILEQRDHAAAAAEDVPKSHGHKRLPLLRALGGLAHDELGHALRGAHDRCRIDRLVRRHIHEALHVPLERQPRQVLHAADVVEHGLFGVILHQRYVLMGRRMEDNIRTITPEDMLERPEIPHVGDDRTPLHIGEETRCLTVDLVNAVLAAAQQQELLWMESGDLPDELGPDRSARAGHQDRPTLDIIGDVVGVETDGLTAQQVLYVDLADLRDGNAAADELVDAGNNAVVDLGLLREIHNAAHHRTRLRRNGDDDFVDALHPRDCRKVVNASEHAQPEIALAFLRRVVIDEANGEALRLRVAQHLPRDHRACLAGADDEDPAAPLTSAVGQMRPFLEDHPYRQTGAAEQNERVDSFDKRNAPRNGYTRGDERENLEAKRVDPHSDGQRDEVTQARPVPASAVEPQITCNDGLNGKAEQDNQGDVGEVTRGLRFESNIIGRHQSERPEHDINI